MADLLERPDLLRLVIGSARRRGSPTSTRSSVGRGTDEPSADAVWWLSPIDLQVIKACGVTFAVSAIERVIEERAGGQADRARDLRDRLTDAIGQDLSAVRPGSEAAARLKVAAHRGRALVAVPRGGHRAGRRGLHQGTGARLDRHPGPDRRPPGVRLEQLGTRGRAGGGRRRPDRRRDARQRHEPARLRGPQRAPARRGQGRQRELLNRDPGSACSTRAPGSRSMPCSRPTVDLAHHRRRRPGPPGQQPAGRDQPRPARPRPAGHRRDASVPGRRGPVPRHDVRARPPTAASRAAASPTSPAISSRSRIALLGRLVNEVALTETIEPWTFGIRSLWANIEARRTALAGLATPEASLSDAPGRRDRPVPADPRRRAVVSGRSRLYGDAVPDDPRGRGQHADDLDGVAPGHASRRPVPLPRRRRHDRRDPAGPDDRAGDPAGSQLDASHGRRSGSQDFDGLDLRPGDRLVYRLGWDRQLHEPGYFSDMPRLSVEAARWLAGRRLALLGMDCPTPNPEDMVEVHQVLLGAGTVLLESLANLDRLEPGAVLVVGGAAQAGRLGRSAGPGVRRPAAVLIRSRRGSRSSAPGTSRTVRPSRGRRRTGTRSAAGPPGRSCAPRSGSRPQAGRCGPAAGRRRCRRC